MKSLFVINNHSFIDVITNSSTELFVADTDKNIEMVKDILNEMLEHYNETVKKGYVSGHETTFDECFGDIYVYTEEMLARDKKEWAGYEWGYETKENIGKIFIMGKSSNSIPYEMFDWIERAMSVQRYHLG